MKNKVELLGFRTNNPEITDTAGRPINQLKLVELAGRTCYKSQDRITEDSAEKFANALIKSGHEAMIEFSWLTFKFPKAKFKGIGDWLINALKHEIPIKVTEAEHYFLVSGNFRTFRTLLKRLGGANNEQSILIAIYLLHNYPAIIKNCLNEWENYKLNSLGARPSQVSPEYWHNKFQANGFYNLPKRLNNEEKLKHYWIAARFIGSRAFTHQLVRHRWSSFAQESQRYCDEQGFFEREYYIVPPSIIENGLERLLVDGLAEINSLYQNLLQLLEESGLRGKKLKEDARFLLPNAVASEICMAGNLEQWFRVFDLRLDAHAQWEIRGIMEELQRQLSDAVPETKKLYDYWCQRTKK